jgi:hypothetical protein
MSAVPISWWQTHMIGQAMHLSLSSNDSLHSLKRPLEAAIDEHATMSVQKCTDLGLVFGLFFLGTPLDG